MTEQTAAISCRFASGCDVYKDCYRQRYLLIAIITGYVRQNASLLL